MNIFDAITEREKNMIYNYIERYAGGTGNIASLDWVLRHWAREKEPIFKLFGEKLIVKKEVDIEKDTEHLTEDIYAILHTRKDPTFYERFQTAVATIEAAYNKIDDNNGGDYFSRTNYWNFRNLLNDETLAKNTWDRETTTIEIGDKEVKIQRGAKPMRILQKIFSYYGFSEIFEEFRLKHSMILNDKHFRGTLCLSIHPLDYMTMSDNSCDWNSCMNWRNQGSYRRGTVEMMNSPMAVVAYLESESSKFYIGNEEWNSKKWRELILYDKGCFVCGVKGYPMWNKNIEKAAVQMMKEYCSEDFGSIQNIEPWNREWQYLTNFKSYNIYFDPDCDAMYNDFNEEVGHYGCFSKSYLEENYPSGLYLHIDFNYSGISSCMRCGDEVYYEDGNEWELVCENCSNIVHCCCCGEAIELEDAYDVDGDYYCEYCYDNETFKCPITGEREGLGDCNRVYFMNKELNQKSEAFMDISYRGIQALIAGEEYAWNNFKHCIGEKVNLYKIKYKTRWWTDESYAVDLGEISIEDLDWICDRMNGNLLDPSLIEDYLYEKEDFEIVDTYYLE